MYFFTLVSWFSLVASTQGCARMEPTTSPKTSCCSVDIADKTSTGRFLFHPALNSCPTEATFICSIQEDGSTSTTRILINGQTEIASGAGGTNSMTTLTCNFSDQRWNYENDVVVNSIRCAI